MGVLVLSEVFGILQLHFPIKMERISHSSRVASKRSASSSAVKDSPVYATGIAKAAYQRYMENGGAPHREARHPRARL